MIVEKESQESQPRDWGMAYFWPAEYLPKLLPESIAGRLREAQVNPWESAKDVETMAVVNVKTGGTIREDPSPGGGRVGRRALRKLMSEQIEVKKATCSQGYPSLHPQTVRAECEGRHSLDANLLIGADDGKSFSRATPLPFKMLNFNAKYPDDPYKARYIRDNLRPFADHGIHPMGVCFFKCLKGVRDPGDPRTWSFQVMITYPPKFPVPDCVQEKSREQNYAHDIIKILHTYIAPHCAEPRRSALLWLWEEHTVIPKDTLQICSPKQWDNRSGRVTLVGDAAHAVSFYRGQSFNDCIRGAVSLVDQIVKIVNTVPEHRDKAREEHIGQYIGQYDAEVFDRARGGGGGGEEVKLSAE
ncbi:hypothetical protein AJ79_09222 [Helicocarpus griseus UAMH5409]|uniref:FAD-binding domain-containing protein n=1 Tax=Helicocarpus griseus UAMH5409 TaxID=1447875 RepID=A0A2B7WLF6_9EURO|nr:hypothetical protein AJ79_09222 [Helicocarpus griseus UAMH5409]